MRLITRNGYSRLNSCVSLFSLSPHVSKTNKYLPDNSQLRFHFIIVLATLLWQARPALNGSDKTKVEFSERKPVFSARFLIVGMPFHSQYLRDAMDKVIDKDLNSEELSTAEGLQIPVYHTEDSKSND